MKNSEILYPISISENGAYQLSLFQIYKCGTYIKRTDRFFVKDALSLYYRNGVGVDFRDYPFFGILVLYCDRIASNATDDNTRKLDDIVRKTKARKETGIKYMKSWDLRKELENSMSIL